MGNSRVKVVEFRPYDVISSLLKQKVEIILLKVLVNLHFLFVPVSNIYLPDRRPYYIIGTALSHFSKLSCAEQRNGRPNSVILCVCVCVCVCGWVGGWGGGNIFCAVFFLVKLRQKILFSAFLIHFLHTISASSLVFTLFDPPAPGPNILKVL